MNYQGQPDKTSCTSVPYGDIYCFKFHEIPYRGYLIIANYMDFKSIQGL